MVNYSMSAFGKANGSGLEVKLKSWSRSGGKKRSFEIELDDWNWPGLAEQDPNMKYLYRKEFFDLIEPIKYIVLILDTGKDPIVGQVLKIYLKEKGSQQSQVTTFCAYSNGSDPYKPGAPGNKPATYRITVGENDSNPQNPFLLNKTLGWAATGDPYFLIPKGGPEVNGQRTDLKIGRTPRNGNSLTPFSDFNLVKWKDPLGPVWKIALLTSGNAIVGALEDSSSGVRSIEVTGVFGAEYP